MGEYINIFVMSTLATILFLGGPSNNFIFYLLEPLLKFIQYIESYLWIFNILMNNYLSILKNHLPYFIIFFFSISVIILSISLYFFIFLEIILIPNIIYIFDISSSLIFVIKIDLVVFIILWVRASVPRYRYDSLMRLTWKVFLPITFGYLLFTGGILLLLDAYPII